MIYRFNLDLFKNLAKFILVCQAGLVEFLFIFTDQCFDMYNICVNNLNLSTEISYISLGILIFVPNRSKLYVFGTT